MNDNINNPPVGSIDNTSLNTEYNVDVEVVYLTIPTKWIPVYRKLLSLIANGGKAILDDCNYGCKGNGSVVFNCWNIFQSACAAHTEGRNDEAELFINYVSKQINAYNKSNGIKVNDTGFKYTITPDGKVKAYGVIEDDVVSLSLDKENKEAYDNYQANKDNGKVFVEQNN
ncbi:MAG: hypothetical protein PUJ60_01845 [bacterium]|nr:hypothetical protein [bacterium]MDY4108893.1 hypothetical protein [Bacilli bacterium]